MLTAKNKKFYLDGEEFIIHSGSFHYFRALPEYWEDILQKIKCLGFNTVETYTAWNLHEAKHGVYDFSGMLDIEKYIKCADKLGLKVILRTGPYICAEFENGGLPAWLFKKEYNVRLRCNTEPYLTFLKSWLHVLFDKIKPYLDTNGGPVIALAVENEYGSFGDDFNYLKSLEDFYRAEGIDCFLFASDGDAKFYIETGKTGKHLTTGIDCGGVISDDNFAFLDTMEPDTPHFVAEHWAGDFTDWEGTECKRANNEHVKKSFDYYARTDTSFNIYMVYGGTNFAFMNGAQDCVNGGGRYYASITSYDYDAAISEWGGYTEKYFIMRDALKKYHGDDLPPLPKSPKLQTVGKVTLSSSASLFDNLHIGKSQKSVAVEPMEEYDQAYGYILYRKIFDYDSECNSVKLCGIRDRAYVFLNGEFKAMRMRDQDEGLICFGDVKICRGDRLDILVENMGRINYGEPVANGDRKGIVEGIFITRKQGDRVRVGKTLFNWEVVSLELDDISAVSYNEGVNAMCPAFFKGHFKASANESCFVHFDNFKKGVIYVNGFNLGRYWEKGPQTALYLPGTILKEENEIVVFEAEGIKGDASVEINNIHGLPNHHEEIIVK